MLHGSRVMRLVGVGVGTCWVMRSMIYKVCLGMVGTKSTYIATPRVI